MINQEEKINIFKTIRSLVAKKISAGDENLITKETKLIGDQYGPETISFLEIILEIERVFSVRFNDAYLNRLEQIRVIDLVDYTEKLIGEK